MDMQRRYHGCEIVSFPDACARPSATNSNVRRMSQKVALLTIVVHIASVHEIVDTITKHDR